MTQNATAPSAAMVLAAGFGSRMRHLTQNRPKPLLPVAGRTLLDHALDRLHEVGVGRAVVNLHYRSAMIREHLAARDAPPQITFSDEDPILETGGGVAKALPLLGPDPFFTINSDAIWTGDRALATLTARWDPAQMDCLLLTVPAERAIQHSGPGDFFLSDQGRLTRRGEAAKAPFIYTGACILAPGAMAGAPSGPFSMNVIWDRLIAAERLYGVVCEGEWVDVGTPEGLSAAERLLGPAG
jgi:MurNAc alpha-1-phosphate uridylyltransferase